MNANQRQCRRVVVEDITPVMEIYQAAAVDSDEIPLFLDYGKLREALDAPDMIWAVESADNKLAGVISALIDKEQGLCKLHSLYVDPQTGNEMTQGNLLDFMKKACHDSGHGVDIFYTTTRALDLDKQSTTLKSGFNLLGVFPGAISLDNTRLNGLTAHFFPGVLKDQRSSDFDIHPTLEPLYEIVRGECGLKPLKTATPTIPSNSEAQRVPDLEVITAPRFVTARFQRIKQRLFLSSTYYPFQSPDILITDPDGKVEVYVKVMEKFRFATIIGEHLTIAVDPLELYEQVCEILYKRNITYIELVNDAADSIGIDFILCAGFLPCSWFPCLKRHGNIRRDYVIFSKCFERFALPKETRLDESYRNFLTQYYRYARDLLLPGINF